MVSRDLDSRVSPREVEAVREWLATSRTFHIMRDHPQVSPKTEFHRIPIILGEN